MVTNNTVYDAFGKLKFVKVTDKYLYEVDSEKFIKTFDIGDDLLKCKNLGMLLYICGEYTEDGATVTVGNNYVYVSFTDYDIEYEVSGVEIQIKVE